MSVPRQDFKPSIVCCTPIRFLPGEDGVVYPEPLSVLWYRAMKTLLMPPAYNVGDMRIDGLEVGEARNLAVKTARERGFKYLMFIDSDTCLPQNGLQQLVWDADNYPEFEVISGLYTNKGTPTFPLIWKNWGEGTYWDFTLGDVIEDVVGCPMGATIIRLSLFDRLPYSEEDPWFKTVKRTEGEGDQAFNYAMTEDLYFCRRAVEEASARIMVDTRVCCQHVDWKTGRIYQLAPESLPVRRMNETEATTDEKAEVTVGA